MRLVTTVVQRLVIVPAVRFVAPPTLIGRERLDTLDGPAVFVANHQSHLDAPVVLAALGARLRRRLRVAAAADYFYRYRLVGAAVSVGLGAFPFERSGRRSLDRCKTLLRNGSSLLIFPSGSRGSRDLRRGFAYVSVDTGRPVVPLRLEGLDRILPKGALVPVPGPVLVRVGPVLAPGDDYDALVRRTTEVLAG